MKRKWVLGAILLVIGAVGLIIGRAPVQAPDRRALPRLEFTDVEGRKVTVDAFAGKVVLLDFWASWCKPCRDEFAMFDRMQERYGPKGFVVVPVSIDLKGMPAVDTFYAETGVTHLAKYCEFVRAPRPALLDLRAFPARCSSIVAVARRRG